MIFDENKVGQLLQAVYFAAEKHRLQKRKDAEKTPYINHPLEIATLLWDIGKIRDLDIIMAGILHDTIEDTQTTAEEIAHQFNPQIASWVQEVSDDKKLPKQERKRLQIVHASHHSIPAKQIKLADKIGNVRSIGISAPQDWDIARQKEYIDWAEKVVAGLRGCNSALESLFDTTVQEVRKIVNGRVSAQTSQS